METMMKAVSNDDEPFSRLLLRWLAYRISLTVAAIVPAHRADQVAAIVATTNNPSGV